MLYFNSCSDQKKIKQEILKSKNKNEEYYNHLEIRNDLSKILIINDKANIEKVIKKTKKYKYN